MTDVQETETTMATIDAVGTGSVGLVRRASHDVVLMPVMDVRLAQQRLEQLQEFCATYLQESKDGGADGGDYGIIPGAGKKRVLFKSGAEKLCDVYGLADRYLIIAKVEDYGLGLFDYTIQCDLTRKTDDLFVGSALSSCSTWEAKYRWREPQRTCPACSATAIIKGKAEFGGGWLCWAKKGGCGAKFADSDPAITSQKMERTENPDIVDAKNTVLKMAQKRAKVSAVIGATRTSGIFTPDLEEYALPDLEVTAVVTPETTTPHGPAVSKADPAVSPQETHAEKIARVKREAAAHKGKEAVTMGANAHKPVDPAPAAGKETMPHATGDVVKGAGPATVEAEAEVQPAAPLPEGQVRITAINVRNGPMVMKDGKSQPSWGPLYIIAFSHKVRASDGVMVTDASTFTQADAATAEAARDGGIGLTPVVEPGNKKGSYKLARFA